MNLPTLAFNSLVCCALLQALRSPLARCWLSCALVHTHTHTYAYALRRVPIRWLYSALHSPCRCRCATCAVQDWFLGGCAASASMCIFQFASDRRVVRISAASVYIESQNSVVFFFPFATVCARLLAFLKFLLDFSHAASTLFKSLSSCSFHRNIVYCLAAAKARFCIFGRNLLFS